MADRELIFGAEDDSDTTYLTRDGDPDGGGNFQIVELDGGETVLLEWDVSAGEWVSRGPVNLDGNDVTNVGSFDADSVNTDEISRNAGLPTTTIYRDPDTDEAVAVGPGGDEIDRQSGTGRIGPVIESVLDSEGGRTHIFVEGAYYSIEDGDAVTGIDWPSRVTIEFAAGVQVTVTEELTNSVGDDNLSVVFDVRLPNGQINNVQFVGHRSTFDCGGNVDIPFYFASGRNQTLHGFEIQSPTVAGWRFAREEDSGTEFNLARQVNIIDPDSVDPEWNGQFIGGTDPRCFECEGPGQSGWLFRDTGKIQAGNLVWTDKGGQTDGIVLDAASQPVNGSIGYVVAEADSDPRSIVRVNGDDGNVEKLDGGPIAINNSGADTAAVQLNDQGGSGEFGKTTWDIKVDRAGGSDDTIALDVVAGSPAVGTRANVEYDAGDGNVFNVISGGDGIVVVNGTGREAAGSGNSPSEDWPYGILIENTDDNTIWTMDQTHSPVQLD